MSFLLPLQFITNTETRWSLTCWKLSTLYTTGHISWLELHMLETGRNREVAESLFTSQVVSIPLHWGYTDPTTLQPIISKLSINSLNSWNAISLLCWPQNRSLSRAEYILQLKNSLRCKTLHLALYPVKLTNPYRWNLSCQNCNTLSAFNARTIWYSLNAKYSSTKFACLSMCIYVWVTVYEKSKQANCVIAISPVHMVFSWCCWPLAWMLACIFSITIPVRDDLLI